MRKSVSTALLISVAILTVALVAIFSGPLFPLNPRMPQFSIPQDMESYLAQREYAAGDVKPGQEKKIVWADPAKKEKTKIALVYLHGFSASRAEIAPVPEELAKELGANLFMTRLAGHGLKNSVEALGSVSAQDFVNDAYEAMEIGKRLGDQVVPIGMSTGAMLALHLAKNFPDIYAVVMLAPNFHPKDWRAKYLAGPLGKWIARAGLGTYREFKTVSTEHADFWTPRYRSEGVVAMMDLLNYVATMDLSQIKPPVLTVYSDHDEVVDVAQIKKRVPQIKSYGSRIVDGTATYPAHVLAGQILNPAGNEPLKTEIKKFLAEIEVLKPASAQAE